MDANFWEAALRESERRVAALIVPALEAAVAEAVQSAILAALDRPPRTRLTVRPAEAAAMLGVSKDTLRAMVRRGRVRAIRLQPQTVVFAVADLQRLVEGSSVVP